MFNLENEIRNRLRNFAYKINLTVWTLLLGAGAALVGAPLTIGFQTTKTALMNPVDTLCYE
jgi:hypothetical protein